MDSDCVGNRSEDEDEEEEDEQITYSTMSEDEESEGELVGLPEDLPAKPASTTHNKPGSSSEHKYRKNVIAVSTKSKLLEKRRPVKSKQRKDDKESGDEVSCDENDKKVKGRTMMEQNRKVFTLKRNEILPATISNASDDNKDQWSGDDNENLDEEEISNCGNKKLFLSQGEGVIEDEGEEDGLSSEYEDYEDDNLYYEYSELNENSQGYEQCHERFKKGRQIGTGKLNYEITLTETETVFPVSTPTVLPLSTSNGSNINPFNSISGFSSNSMIHSQSPASLLTASESGTATFSAFSFDSYANSLNAQFSWQDQINSQVDSEPAQYILKMIINQFVTTVNSKIEQLLLKDVQFVSCKPLQFGDDPVFDQLLESLYEVSEHSLPSVLRSLFHWHDNLTSAASRNETLAWISTSTQFSKNSSAHQIILDKRDLYIDFALGMGLLQACKQLEKHPVEEELLTKIEHIAFNTYFKPSARRLNAASKPELFNLLILVADLYAQLVGGELVNTRFSKITTWFKSEFRNLKKLDASPGRTQAFVCLIMGLRFFRVKMFPIQEFDMSFQFVHELARYFQDSVLVKEKEIRHKFAGLLVEILLPVAAVVKNEVNIPVVKNLVKTYFDQTRQAAEKKKHAVAMFPLVTCLLAISHTDFFTQQWTSFTNICLSSLRNKDVKISRAALESLYRLLWVYMVRIKEDNVVTGHKLQPICNSLFPKNSRSLNPRDMPLMIFVKIIHFIAQEKLDFAMREIIFELLQVSKLPKITITPERMIVGLRAFLLIADQLQQQPIGEKHPPMPMNTSSGSLPSGCRAAHKPKRSLMSAHNLTETLAMNYGLGSYFGHVCKALGVILYHLDTQIGRPMLTHVMNFSPTKEHRDIISTLAAADKKAKLDLFRTCIAAIPRLLPQPLTMNSTASNSSSISSRNEVLDLMCRLADHSEEELRALAISHIGNIIKELPDWRPDVLSRLILFIVKEIPDTIPATLESMIRILLQLISKWRECLHSEVTSNLNATTAMSSSSSGAAAGGMNTVKRVASPSSPPMVGANANSPPQHQSSSGTGSKSKCNSLNRENTERCISSIRKVEALGLCMLCQLRPNTRKLAVMLLKEAQSLASDLNLVPPSVNISAEGITQIQFIPLVVRLDASLPKILQSMLPLLTTNERFWAATASQPDLNWLCEKTCSMWCVNTDYGLPFECVPQTTVAPSSTSSVAGGDNATTSNSDVGQGNSGTTGLNTGSNLVRNTAVGVRKTFDPWMYSIAQFIDSTSPNSAAESILGCSLAVSHACTFATVRISLMSNLIDQMTPQEFSKATLTRAPKRPNPINDYYLCLWRNYLTLVCSGCCSSTKYTSVESCNLLTSHSPPLLLSSPSSQSVIEDPTGVSIIGSSLPVANVGDERIESIGKLLRNTIIPILRGEHIHLKEVTVQAIGFTNSHALRSTVEEFSTLVREATDRRPDKRRIKKRAELRLMLVRIFSRISERGVISQCLFANNQLSTLQRSFSSPSRKDLESSTSMASSNNVANSVASFFYDLIDCYRQCLDTSSSASSSASSEINSEAALFTETKIHFSKLIHFMIKHAPEQRSTRTFSSEIQRVLFDLTSTWCGALGRIANFGKTPPSSQQSSYTQLELAALEAMCSIISSEPDEGNTFLCEESYIYTWLQYMLLSQNSTIYELGCTTIETLLKKNIDNNVLLKWLFSQCFQLRSLPLSHACFTSVISVCSQLDIAQLHNLEVNAASFLLLALFFADSSDLCIREKALQFLYLLCSKLIGVIDVFAENAAHNKSSSHEQDDVEASTNSASTFLYIKQDHYPTIESGFDESFFFDNSNAAAAHSKTQKKLSKQLSKNRPELTYAIISEAVYRFEKTSPAGKDTLLKCILPWMENIELVEPSFLPSFNNNSSSQPSINLTQTWNPAVPFSSTNRSCSSPSAPVVSGLNLRAGDCNNTGSPFCRQPALHFTPLSWATGWGSTTTTDMVLNNLFYITVQFCSEHSDSLRKIWQKLCNSFHNNCSIILRFLLQMVAVSFRCSKFLAAAKTVVAFIASGSQDHVIPFLLAELTFIDTLPNNVKKCSNAPHFQIHSTSGSMSTSSSSTSHRSSTRITKSDSTASVNPCSSQPTANVPVLTTNTLPADNANRFGLPLAMTKTSINKEKERHSTLPVDFYHQTNVVPSVTSSNLATSPRHEKSVSVPIVAAAATSVADKLSNDTSLSSSSTISPTRTATAEDVLNGSSNYNATTNKGSTTNTTFTHSSKSNDKGGCDTDDNIKSTHLAGKTPEKFYVHVGSHNKWLLYWKINFFKCNLQQAKPLPVGEELYFCPLSKLILTNSTSSSLSAAIMESSYNLSGAYSSSQVAAIVANGNGALLQRNFASLILCSHLLITDITYDWNPFIPLLLHLSVLALDNYLPLVVTHARRTLINLILTQLDTDTEVTCENLLLRSSDLVKSVLTPPYLTRPPPTVVSNVHSQSESLKEERSVAKDLLQLFLDIDDGFYEDHQQQQWIDDAACRLAKILLDNMTQPLWIHEDVSVRNYELPSYDKLNSFVSIVIHLFENFSNNHTIPPPQHDSLRADWADLSLQMALCSSSRHYASRSFQVYRSLEVVPSSSDLSEILIRLNDTVTDTGEETQGYVIEILKTLSKISHILSQSPQQSATASHSIISKSSKRQSKAENEVNPQSYLPLSSIHERKPHSTSALSSKAGGISTNTSKQQRPQKGPVEKLTRTTEGISMAKSKELDLMYRRTCSYTGNPNSNENTSQTPANVGGKMKESSLNSEPSIGNLKASGAVSKTLDSHQYSEVRHRDLKVRSQCLPRNFGNTVGAAGRKVETSRTGHVSRGLFDNKLSMLSQIFWAVVSLLESDFEHEYFLALQLLDQLLDFFDLCCYKQQNVLCKVFHQMKWNTTTCFSGLQPLVLKGLTLPSALPLANKILIRFTPMLQSVSFLDLNKRGLMVNVVSLLPMLFEAYDEPSESLLECADSIALECDKMAEESSHPEERRKDGGDDEKSSSSDECITVTESNSLLTVSIGQYKSEDVGDNDRIDIDEDRESLNSASNATIAASISSAWKNLASVMRMYSRQSHVKDSISWLAAVSQYMGEALSLQLISLIDYISELLERGPSSYQNCLLHMTCNFIQLIDLQNVPREKFNTTTINILLHKFMLQNNPEWKNALNVLKLIVTRSSTLCSPNSSQRRVQQLSCALEEAVIYRRQIPGRTLSFAYAFPIPPIGAWSKATTRSASGSIVNQGPSDIISTTDTTAPLEVKSSAHKLVPSNGSNKMIERFSSMEGVKSTNTQDHSKTSNNVSQHSSPQQKTTALSGQSTSTNQQVNQVSSSATAAQTFVRQVSTGGTTCAAFSVEAWQQSQFSNWKKPLFSQKRVRDKMSGVIRSFGPRAVSLASASGYEKRSGSGIGTPMGGAQDTSGTNGDSANVSSSNTLLEASGGGGVVGSIEDITSTPTRTGSGGGGSIDIGTPSGREDTISVDIFTHFDFLGEFDSEEEGEGNFQFGLRRPSDSSMANVQYPESMSSSAVITDRSMAEQSTKVKKLFDKDSDKDSDTLTLKKRQLLNLSGEESRNKSSVSVVAKNDCDIRDNNGMGAGIVPTTDVASGSEVADRISSVVKLNVDVVDSSDDDEDDDDDYEDGSNVEDDNDDYESEDDSYIETNKETYDSEREQMKSSSLEQEINPRQSSRDEGTFCLNANKTTFPECFICLQPQFEMVDFRLFTLSCTASTFNHYWSQTISCILCVDNDNRTNSNSIALSSRTFEDRIIAGSNPITNFYLSLLHLVKYYVGFTKWMIEESGHLLNFLFSKSLSDEKTDNNNVQAAAPVSWPDCELVSGLRKCFNHLYSLCTHGPLVMLSTNWISEVEKNKGDKRRQTNVERKLRQIVLESSESVTNLKSTVHSCSEILIQLKKDVHGENNNNVSLYVKRAIEFCENIVRSHLQISLLLNQIDKFYDVVCNVDSSKMTNDDITNSAKVYDLSDKIKRLWSLISEGSAENSCDMRSEDEKLAMDDKNNVDLLNEIFYSLLATINSEPAMSAHSVTALCRMIKHVDRASENYLQSSCDDTDFSKSERIVLICVLWNCLSHHLYSQRSGGVGRGATVGDNDDNIVTLAEGGAYYVCFNSDEERWDNGIEVVSSNNAVLKSKLINTSNVLSHSHMDNNLNYNKLIVSNIHHLVNKLQSPNTNYHADQSIHTSDLTPTAVASPSSDRTPSMVEDTVISYL